MEEFLRSLESIWFRFLRDEGCTSYSVYQEFQNEDIFCLVGEFDSHEAMSHHFQSRNFEVLLGSATVLGKDTKMVITDVLEKGGYELAKSKLTS